jgi:hypothetical protein
MWSEPEPEPAPPSQGGTRPLGRTLGGGSPAGPRSPLAAAYAEAQVPLAEPVEPEPMPTAQWQVREPDDRNDPVPHVVNKHVRRNDSWNLTAASVRGKLHAHQALWRDDAFAWDWVGNWTAIAVSDGAGSAPLSRVGARVACEEAVRTVKEQLADFAEVSADGEKPRQEDLLRMKKIILDGAIRSRAAILREAEQRNCAVRDFNATFLLLLHIPFQDADLVAAFQVGDGTVGLFTREGTCSVLGDADHGNYSSETVFLTTPGVELDLKRRVAFVLEKNLLCIGVMTDGVADDFFPEDKRLVELFAGDPVHDLKDAQGGPLHGVMRQVLREPRDGEALADWLRYEKRGSSDDRTLVLMSRNEG